MSTIPKAQWAEGPWHNEPDHAEFRRGKFPCILHRSPVTGSWCGYVGIPPGHPWHRKPYDSIDADVHGGLTYSDECQGHVCHKPEPGEPNDVWWFGFDCAHGGDTSPAMDALRQSYRPGRERWPGEQYRTLDYVRQETENLADQAELAAACGDA